MTQWTINSGDVLAIKADVLICSANVWLNLSGGVGGEILRRHGDAMQRALHEVFRGRQVRYVHRGEIYLTQGFGTGFEHVVHAVAIDGMYQSSAAVVHEVMLRSLEAAAGLGAKRVATVAMGTGYGRLPIADFAAGIKPIFGSSFEPVQEIIISMKEPEQAAEVRKIVMS